MPKAKEGKFDVDEYREKLEKETSVAEKLHKLAEFGKSEKFGFISKDFKMDSVPLVRAAFGHNRRRFSMQFEISPFVWTSGSLTLSTTRPPQFASVRSESLSHQSFA